MKTGSSKKSEKIAKNACIILEAQMRKIVKEEELN
jgi:hypothetical protein